MHKPSGYQLFFCVEDWHKVCKKNQFGADNKSPGQIPGACEFQSWFLTHLNCLMSLVQSRSGLLIFLLPVWAHSQMCLGGWAESPAITTTSLANPGRNGRNPLLIQSLSFSKRESMANHFRKSFYKNLRNSSQHPQV